MKRDIKTMVLMTIGVLIGFFLLGQRATNETYTVKTPVWETTNAIQVIPNHEPGCHLIRYVESGKTNDFHAWGVPIAVTTNKARNPIK